MRRNDGEYDHTPYHKFVKTQQLRAIKGGLVKSYEELLIANWLAANSVNYRYEARYAASAADRGHRQYRPDFYLPDASV